MAHRITNRTQTPVSGGVHLRNLSREAENEVHEVVLSMARARAQAMPAEQFQQRAGHIQLH